MGCFGALFRKTEPEPAPAYAPPPSAVAKAEARASTMVEPTIPKEVAHFEPCGCGALTLARDELPAYSALSDEFKDDAVGPRLLRRSCDML